MTGRLLLVTTCGTSILTHGATADERAWLRDAANSREIDAALLTPLLADRRSRLAAADTPALRRMSAELNGVHAVLDRYRPGRLFHVLVHTDTALGEATADLVEEVIRRTSGGEVARLSAPGLRTDHLPSFRAALADLTGNLVELVEAYRATGCFAVFNLTGGFKSLNAYLQTLGMVSADRCVFLFEGATELLEIPRLPIRLAEAETLRRHLDVFRRLAVGYAVRAEEVADAPEALFMEEYGTALTNGLGDLTWNRHRTTLLSERLLAPLSGKVRVREAVRRAFDKLDPRHRVQVNEALDEFCAMTDGVRPLLKSRTFKKLQGNPVPGSTHELYAWSGEGAGRLFGHYEGDAFVFNDLTDHL